LLEAVATHGNGPLRDSLRSAAKSNAANFRSALAEAKQKA
jgi:hypothetical protein